jgi:hypothetical protein
LVFGVNSGHNTGPENKKPTARSGGGRWLRIARWFLSFSTGLRHAKRPPPMGRNGHGEGGTLANEGTIEHNKHMIEFFPPSVKRTRLSAHPLPNPRFLVQCCLLLESFLRQ